MREIAGAVTIGATRTISMVCLMCWWVLVHFF